MNWVVTKEEEGNRLDKFLAERKEFSYSRSYLSKCIQEGYVFFNGEKAKASLKKSPWTLYMKTMIFWW